MCKPLVLPVVMIYNQNLKKSVCASVQTDFILFLFLFSENDKFAENVIQYDYDHRNDHFRNKSSVRQGSEDKAAVAHGVRENAAVAENRECDAPIDKERRNKYFKQTRQPS